jgi:hypothetical protein
MWILALIGCNGSYDEGSDVCGRIVRVNGAPQADSVSVMTIADGHEACEHNGDTGGIDTDGQWWDDVVASPTADKGRFEATIDPGDYAVEVVAGGGGYGGCTAFNVPDTSHCVAEPVVTVDEIITVDKPNLYLYPPVVGPVRVHLPAWQRITESDPAYPVDGWRVVAGPQGRLRTSVGPRDYLFYEMSWDPERFQTTSGWCAAGPTAQATIEDAMADLGFRPNEIADFADAWDADFPEADAFTIYPQRDDLAALRIDPPPDNLLRAWFYVVEGCHSAEMPVFEAVPRKGFHAAEWGVAFADGLAPHDVLVEGWR